MKRRAGLFLACAAALAMCSCGAKSESEKADAAAQREESRARADAARMEDLRVRWNEAVPDAPWEPDKFPHPASKGGSPEAYGAFAKTLVKFFETNNNLGYVQNNNLAAAELRYALPDGKVSKCTFAELAEELSKPAGPGNHDEATRKALGAAAKKLKEPASAGGTAP